MIKKIWYICRGRLIAHETGSPHTLPCIYGNTLLNNNLLYQWLLYENDKMKWIATIYHKQITIQDLIKTLMSKPKLEKTLGDKKNILLISGWKIKFF